MCDHDPEPGVVMSDSAIIEESNDLLGDAVALRRRLHVRPELGLHLPETQAAVLEALSALPLTLTTGRETTSVVAVLEGSQPGPTTLLRGDMDALPLHEDTGLEFASGVDGAMHACGHDAHVAMLAGAARLLSGRRTELAGRVVFMFQPGEEGFGGAAVMLAEGLREHHGTIDRAFAIHMTPSIPAGVVATRPGALMASSDSFTITITGKGGHASMPHEAVDPIPVACELVTALQAMLTRRVDVFDPAVITVASITAGTTFNVLPETAVLLGTIRAVSEKARRIALDGLTRVAEHIAAAHLCQASIEWPMHDYPVTVNSDPAAERTLGVATDLLGAGRVVRMPSPVMGAEDWSFVLQRVPGSMAFLGARPDGIAHPAPNHSNRMMIDEDAMATGIALHAAMALAPAV
ncbi:MAG: M20 family metallopeptidase [Acidimicrobiales bacterium]